VNGSDIAVELALLPQPSVSGIVQVPTDSDKRNLSVALRLVRNSSIFTAPVLADGTFRFPNVAPGLYEVLLRSPVGLFPTKIEARGGALRERMLEVPESGDLTLSINTGTETGELRGFAMDGERPIPSVLVVLQPKQTAALGAFTRGFQTESDGSFDFKLIPAGTYAIFAVNDTALEYLTPAITERYLRQAKEVSVAPHAAGEIRVDLTPEIR
jgi:hypothetical protein